MSRELSVVLGRVIDGHMQCRFFIRHEGARRFIGSLVVAEKDVDIVRNMIETAGSAQHPSISLTAPVTYSIRDSP